MALFILMSSGCVSSGSNKADPWERWNRSVFKFNKTVDSAIAKPLTQGYQAVTPDIVEKGVTNVLANLNDIPNMINNFLQGKILESFSDLARFTINSSLGIAGLWDPASDMGLEKHDEDFGQTLGAWGVASGPYVMLPLLGPKTLRGTFAYPVGSEIKLLNRIDHIPTRNQAKLLDLIDTRAGFIKYEVQLEDVIDEYAFIRDAYLQNRRYKVLDGDIPFEDECEEEEDEDCDF